jgi:hypothetical protein
MKFFAATIVATALLTSPAALQDLWHQHEMRARAEEAGRILRNIYVRTDAEKIHVVSAYAEPDGQICIEITDQGGDPASVEYDWIIARRDHRIEYNLDRDDFENRCEGAAAGENVLPAVERGTTKRVQ